MKRYTFSKKTVIEKYGVQMLEIRNSENKVCGYSEVAFEVPEKCFLAESTETFIFKESEIRGGEIRGGEIRGGVIWGGVIWGGEIRGGEIRGGVIWGGVIWGGEIWGGVIWGGVIRGGEIWGGEIWGGEIRGGEIWGGEIWGGEIRGGEIWGGEIWGGVIEFTLIQIQGTKHFVSVDYFGTPEIKLNIGCHSRTIDDWLVNFDNVGKQNGYNHSEIAEYKRYIDLLNEMYFKS